MMVGLPGSGIGGLFYLGSALWMPAHSLIRRMRGARVTHENSPRDGRIVARQFGIAVLIIAALWMTGWLIGVVVISQPNSLGSLGPAVASRGMPNALRAAAFYVSLTTLVVALLSVEIARLVVRPRPSLRRQAAAAAAGSLIILFAPRVLAQESPTAASDGHLAAAEAAYSAGDTANARREYLLVLAGDADNGRALFRLGLLSRNDPHRAEEYFRSYISVEPTDAWGYVALGDALARERRYHDALSQYDRARAIAPSERDVHVGRARILVLAGRTDDALSVLSKWTADHPDDTDALRLLRDQRRRARPLGVPTISMATSGSTDSDGNHSFRAGSSAAARIADVARAELYAGRKRTTGFSEVTITDAGAALTVKPNAAWQLETSIGAVHPVEEATVFAAADRLVPSLARPLMTTVPGTGNGRGRGRGSGGGGDTATVPQPPPGTIVNPDPLRNITYVVGGARARWRQPGGLGLVDVRASRTALDANTLLLINRVTRSEVAARADIPFTSRLRARTGARVGHYDATDETNNRTSLLGGLAYSATRAIEVSAIFQRLAFDHSTASGYFAPRLAQLAEAGWYAEFETERGTVLTLDGGGGMQRQAGFGEAVGEWKPAFRLYALFTVPIAKPGSEVRIEFDSYDSRLGSEAATSSSWRSASVSAAVRFALR
jgi:tetratricopeptide (TPR) repeat protein